MGLYIDTLVHEASFEWLAASIEIVALASTPSEYLCIFSLWSIISNHEYSWLSTIYHQIIWLSSCRCSSQLPSLFINRLGGVGGDAFVIRTSWVVSAGLRLFWVWDLRAVWVLMMMIVMWFAELGRLGMGMGMDGIAYVQDLLLVLRMVTFESGQDSLA